MIVDRVSNPPYSEPVAETSQKDESLSSLFSWDSLASLPTWTCRKIYVLYSNVRSYLEWLVDAIANCIFGNKPASELSQPVIPVEIKEDEIIEILPKFIECPKELVHLPEALKQQILRNLDSTIPADHSLIWERLANHLEVPFQDGENLRKKLITLLQYFDFDSDNALTVLKNPEQIQEALEIYPHPAWLMVTINDSPFVDFYCCNESGAFEHQIFNQELTASTVYKQCNHIIESPNYKQLTINIH